MRKTGLPRSERIERRKSAGGLREVEWCGGELILVKPPVGKALGERAAIKSAAAGASLDMVVSIAHFRGVSTAHFQFNSWEKGRRVLDWWPGNGKWRRPETGETGTEDDWRRVVEIAAGKR